MTTQIAFLRNTTAKTDQQKFTYKSKGPPVHENNDLRALFQDNVRY